MKLSEYLASEGALSVAQLRQRIGVKSDSQMRQWQYGYEGRKPGPGYCVLIESATDHKVRRWDLRPGDWWRIWPDLIDAPGAPPVPNAAPAAAAPVALAA